MSIRTLVLSIASLCVLVAGCTVPRQGALRTELQRGSDYPGISVQPIDESFALTSRKPVLEGLTDEMRLAPVMAMGQLSRGDQLGVTIIEGYSTAVPSAIGGRLELARVDVAPDGSIVVPFAGRLQVAGLPVERARQAIESRLSRKLYKPQVQLRLLESPGKSVSIVGAVRKGGSYPLAPGMARLADLIGAAGLEADQPEQVQLELRRDARSYRLSLKTLLGDPLENVALQPGDVVSVVREIGHVTLMGAVAMPGRIEIAGEEYSVLDALAQARGLDGKSADPSGVYLFPASGRRPAGEPLAIYSIDIRDPRQVLLARQLRLADGDLIYVSTASFAQTIKVLDVISRALTPLSRVPGL